MIAVCSPVPDGRRPTTSRGQSQEEGRHHEFEGSRG